MPRRTYIIVFDASDPDLDFAPIRQHIKESSDFNAWWQHLPSMFLVTSDLDASEIQESIRRHSGDARFLVMAVDPTDSDGWLPEKSWQWIRKRALLAQSDRSGK